MSEQAVYEKALIPHNDWFPIFRDDENRTTQGKSGLHGFRYSNVGIRLKLANSTV